MSDDAGMPSDDQLEDVSDAMRAQIEADGHDDPGDDWSGKMDATYGYDEHTLADYLEGVNGKINDPKQPLSDADIAKLVQNDLSSTLDDLRLAIVNIIY